VLKLPGVDNPKRMEDLVEKSANLEFFEVHANYEYLREGDAIMEKLFAVTSSAKTIDTNATETDTSATKKSKKCKCS